jgi:C-terminal processing protease CtpA/Prc
VGYVRLPGFAGEDRRAVDRHATQLSRAVAAVDASGICGWVVDLRDNPGGNMWPMLAGIGVILGEGEAGGMVDRGGRSTPWSYRGGKARAGALVRAAVDDSVSGRARGDLPVALLLGPRTSSSGEAIAIAFQGRARTRSFGEATDGLTTANARLQLPDGSSLFLAVAYMHDRHGKVYRAGVEPDQPVRPAHGGVETHEPVLGAAEAWLARQPGCRGSPGSWR